MTSVKLEKITHDDKEDVNQLIEIVVQTKHEREDNDLQRIRFLEKEIFDKLQGVHPVSAIETSDSELSEQCAEVDHETENAESEEVHIVSEVESSDAQGFNELISEKAVEEHKKIYAVNEIDGVRCRYSVDEQFYICEICQEGFSQQCNLQRHMKVHDDQCPYVCHICNKNFTSKINYKKHAQSHLSSSDRPYHCDICNKGFLLKNAMRNHRMIHTGEKPYVCDQCDKAFTLKGNLNKHKMTHTGEKRHVCGICHKKFTLVGNLHVHMLIHSGNKMFPCDVCKRSFAQYAGLEKHYLIHTGERPHVCRTCKLTFTQKSHLLRHFKTNKHKINVRESGLIPSSVLQANSKDEEMFNF